MRVVASRSDRAVVLAGSSFSGDVTSRLGMVGDVTSSLGTMLGIEGVVLGVVGVIGR